MSLISALINTKHQHTISILHQYLCFWIRVDCNLIVTIYASTFLTSLQTTQNFRLSNVPFNLHFQSHDWSFTHIWPSFSPPSFSDLLFPPCFFFDFQNQESIPLKALFTIFRLLYCLPKSIQGIPIFPVSGIFW